MLSLPKGSFTKVNFGLSAPKPDEKFGLFACP